MQEFGKVDTSPYYKQGLIGSTIALPAAAAQFNTAKYSLMYYILFDDSNTRNFILSVYKDILVDSLTAFVFKYFQISVHNVFRYISKQQ